MLEAVRPGKLGRSMLRPYKGVVAAAPDFASDHLTFITRRMRSSS
jgi:hypothetical protein